MPSNVERLRIFVHHLKPGAAIVGLGVVVAHENNLATLHHRIALAALNGVEQRAGIAGRNGRRIKTIEP